MSSADLFEKKRRVLGREMHFMNDLGSRSCS